MFKYQRQRALTYIPRRFISLYGILVFYVRSLQCLGNQTELENNTRKSDATRKLLTSQGESRDVVGRT